MDDIIKLLNFEDPNLETEPIEIVDGKRVLTICLKLIPHFCPICSHKMYSKGIYVRTVNHPILQDGIPLVLKVKQRRWVCQNPDCSYTMNDEFSFLEAYKQNTTATNLLIVDAFRDSNLTASEIAKRHNVSDSYAISTFARYVDMPRRQLSEIISIDEVRINVPNLSKYALVIQDFLTGEPIDLLPSRRKDLTEPYFLNIPYGERKNVKFLISDMYKPYIGYIDKYFPNATSVVDSFHVVKYINDKLLAYMRRLARELDARDRELHEAREQAFHRHIHFSHSNEYYVIKNFSWVILKNQESLKYGAESFWNPHLKRYLDIYALEDMIFKIDPKLKELRALKEKYIHFNKQYGNNYKKARPALEELIKTYKLSDYKIFRDIAATLETFFDSIVNSFIMVERHCSDGMHISRLSNGPMESLNRIAKDIKRNGRGYRNFNHLRNRFLFARRPNAQILATPRLREEVVPTSKARGKYKK